ncbi:MAG: glycosyl hydrolase family 18 protein, partial [Bacteroidota bacterium]|nr:glycosyl hydrolase family 18 protein [Bacteroidota bacterium]
MRYAVLILLLCAATSRAQQSAVPTAHEMQQTLRPHPAFVPPVTEGIGRTADRERTHVVFGYHPYWIADSVTLHYDFSLLSHLAYFSAEVDPATDEMRSVHGWPDIAVLDRATAAGVKVQLAVTNFGAAGNRSLLSSQAARDTLVRRIVTLLRQRDAHGVSIDFEAVPGDQRRNLTAFFAMLDAALAAELPGAEISAAVPAVDWNDAWDLTALRA